MPAGSVTAMPETVTITDNRTGESVEIPIIDGGVDSEQWRKLLPGETHTAKIRNALQAFNTLIDEHGSEEEEDQLMLRDAIVAREAILDHLAATDKERYELKLAISDLRNSLRILGSRIQEVERLERETHRQLREEQTKNRKEPG